MYDASKVLNDFYNDKLRLGIDGRRKLAGLRDTNLDRLRTGLDKLGPLRGAKNAGFERHLDQGSYAMHTLNQHPDGDYDIDTAVIFDESALPASALDARKRVADALLETGVRFARPPEARTNAVTVWYAEGHHVDLAVYRKTDSGHIEHAGSDWVQRDPSAVTKWFDSRVDELSPYYFPTVELKQLRRIVRFVKRFCVSRRSWKLPGGMITTALVAEIYVANRNRDDVSLRNTLIALRDRLAGDVSVLSPIDGAELTAKPRSAGQVGRLKKRLDEILPKLEVLDDRACDEAAARAAWNAVFRHEFFAPQPVAKQAAPSSVNLTIRVADREDGPLREKAYRASEPPLPKKVHLRFEVAHDLKPGDVIRWIVTNCGDDAEDYNDMGHTVEGRDLVTWRTTRYHGDHTMRCEVLRNGRVTAAATRTVRVD